jgi:hypothetical protein
MKTTGSCYALLEVGLIDMEGMAMTNAGFETVADYMFKAAGQDCPTLRTTNQTYSISLANEIEIHLIGVQENFLNMLCITGSLPLNPSQSMLITLLNANQFNFSYPQVCLGLEPETNVLTVWCRQKLHELDEESAKALFDRFAEMAGLVREWLDNQGEPLRLFESPVDVSQIIWP